MEKNTRNNKKQSQKEDFSSNHVRDLLFNFHPDPICKISWPTL